MPRGARFHDVAMIVRPSWRMASFSSLSLKRAGGPASSASHTANTGDPFPHPKGARAKTSSIAGSVSSVRLSIRIHLDGRAEVVRCQDGSCMRVQPLTEFGYPVGRQSHSGGLPVPAEFREQFGHRFRAPPTDGRPRYSGPTLGPARFLHPHSGRKPAGGTARRSGWRRCRSHHGASRRPKTRARSRVSVTGSRSQISWISLTISASVS